MLDHEIKFGPFRLIPSRRLLLEGDRPLHVGSRALTILQVLVERAGEIVDKRELARLVWPNTFVDEANIRVHISALRRALGDGQNGEHYIVNELGRGYRFAASVSRSEAPSQADRGPETAALTTSTLPNFVTRLIGRGDAVSKLKAELTRERMVTIVGPGGIGKTSLALATAPLWSGESGYEVEFADLALVTDPANVPAAVARALSMTTLYGDSVAAMLHELRHRHLLMILDNCEHVISATASLSQALLTGTKYVRILATSREALRITGEWIHHLAPLRTPPDIEAITATTAMKYPAVQLFVERGMANVDTYEFRDEDAQAVANICRRLDGIPLAIEFAAARVDLLDVNEIAQHLDDRFSLLTKGYRNALPRQQTLRAVIDWSFGLLSLDRKIVLRRLSVFAGHFGVDDAIDVVSGDGIPRLTVLESLSDLVDKSMVLVDVSVGTVSHRLLETTQIYAHEKLREAGEVEAVRLRHALRFLEVCKASSALEDDKRFLSQAMFDVCAALDWALIDGGDITLGIDLAATATPIFLRLSLLRDHRKYLELALAHIVATDAQHDSETRLRAEMILRTAVALALYYTEGLEVAPEDHLQKARAIAQKTGDIVHELKVLWMLYGIAGNAGNYRQEMLYAQMYEAASRASTDAMAAFRRHRVLARALSDLGQHVAAQENLELALRPSREAMPQSAVHAYDIDDWVAGRAALARTLWLRGYPDDAWNVAEQCISEALQLGHEQSTCWALAFHLCPLAIWRGDLSQAGTFTDLLLERSRRVFEHYHEWGLLYRQFLNWSASPSIERKEVWCAKVKPKIAAQTDLFATLDEKLVGPDTLARAQADEDIWCAPEILRAWAHRIMVRGEKTGQSDAKPALDRSLDIARRQGAKAWELRTATTLALFYRGTRQLDEARATLEPVLNHFTQGHGTRDVQAASRLLSELRD